MSFAAGAFSSGVRSRGGDKSHFGGGREQSATPRQNAAIASANASEPIATIATGSSLALLQRDTATPTRAIQIPSSTGTLAAAEASGNSNSKWRLIAMLLQGIGADHPDSNYGGWPMHLFEHCHILE